MLVRRRLKDIRKFWQLMIDHTTFPPCGLSRYCPAYLRTGARHVWQALACIGLWLLLQATPCSAETLIGQVVRVSDGDTVTLSSPTRGQWRIRIAGIDAPELSQAYGRDARRALLALCQGRTARAEVHTFDRYGRAVSRLFCSGIDAAALQVGNGYAWVYQRYTSHHRLLALQAEARTARRGLWAAPRPLPPWRYRARFK